MRAVRRIRWGFFTGVDFSGVSLFVEHIGIATRTIGDDYVGVLNVIIDLIKERLRQNLSIRSFAPKAMVLFNVLLQVQVEVMQFGNERHHDEAHTFDLAHLPSLSFR
jgi:hypothetical protein